MAYIPRTDLNPGDVYPASDQQQSIDNEAELYRLINGPYPPAGSTGGVVRAFVKKTGMADNVSTEVFTITTTNEAGSNDGGVYYCMIRGIFAHGVGPAGDTALQPYAWAFGRAMGGAGAGANSSFGSWGGAPVAGGTGGKTVVTSGMSAAETSEYVVSVKAQIDLGGVVTTGEVYALVELIYAGFSTAPVIASAE